MFFEEWGSCLESATCAGAKSKCPEVTENIGVRGASKAKVGRKGQRRSPQNLPDSGSLHGDDCSLRRVSCGELPAFSENKKRRHVGA